jgi:SNF2 family DNA or RNA helicase
VSLSGAKWHGFEEPPVKQWSFHYNEHTMFQLLRLARKNPYKRFDDAMKVAAIKAKQLKFKHPLKVHQAEGVALFLDTHRVIWGYEMGLGKSLMAIESMEHVRPPYAIWVAPNSALISAQLEYKRWGCTVPCKFMTYEGLKKFVANFSSGDPAPFMIFADEGQKIKTWTSQRSQSFRHLTKAMREEHGDDCFIAVMSGTPAPRTPVDWYALCEAVQPGFLREGDHYKFKERLALVRQQDRSEQGGGVYPEIVTWRDNSLKCKVCGQLEDSYEHTEHNISRHNYESSINEVELLYKRMHGLVIVRSKKDCTDLPDKIYQVIKCKPSRQTLELARLISQTTPTAIQTLTRLRELSDGFQYTEKVDGKETCPTCSGLKQVKQHTYIGPEKTFDFIRTLEPDNIIYVDDPQDYIIDPADHPHLFEERVTECYRCMGAGEVDRIVRDEHILSTAKDKALRDLLEEHDDIGRIVIYAGFTASVNKIVKLCMSEKWDVIRLDGSGWFSTLEGGAESLIQQFQDKNSDKRIAFIGNQGAASTGMTLTASSTIVYYSNTFNGEDRSQSEDRIHRIGMDVNRGARIIDLLQLPTDELVLENIKRKRDLERMSLGQLKKELADIDTNEYTYE